MSKQKPVDPAALEYVQQAIEERSRSISPSETQAAIESARRVRAEHAEREAASLKADMEEIMCIAERATGLTRQQLLSKHAEFSRQVPAPRVDAKTSRETVLARGVPGIHVANVHDREPETCPALEKVKKFLDAEQQVFLVLSGATGTRKSGSSAWGVCNHPGRFISASALSQAALGQEGDSAEKMRLIRNAPLLVLDDIGREYADEKGWFMNVFNALIDERYGAMRKTIITTNLDASAFKARYQERIADRIRELGEWAQVKGASVRRKWVNGGEE